MTYYREIDGKKVFEPKVKTPRAEEGIIESGGVDWINSTYKDSLYHTNVDSLERFIDNELDLDVHDKYKFIMRVQNDPNWEFEDLKGGWYREADRWFQIAENHPKWKKSPFFEERAAYYSGKYPGDKAYRKTLLERKKWLQMTEEEQEQARRQAEDGHGTGFEWLDNPKKKKVKAEDKIMNGFLQQDNKYKMGK